jgi:hypothetical protein
MIAEDLVMLTANEPQNHFLQAEQDISRKDVHAAASELRIAAGYMKMQASRDTGMDQQQLLDAARDVRSVADDVAKSKNTDTAYLKQVFNKANLALACHFQKKADAELKNNKPVMAGHDLQSAVDALRSGLVWTGSSQSDTATVMSNAQKLADQLIGPESKQIKADEGVQTAGAKIKPGDHSESASSTKIPKDASKTIQTLGNAIQKCISSEKTKTKS